MFLSEPPPTSADLHFRLLGFPVRVHPFFWLVGLILGMGTFGSGDGSDPIETLLWVAILFVSILVHELGHALTQRHFGGNPWITLHGMGGLASCRDCDRSPRAQVIIALAGPLAGFVFAAATVLVVRLSGHYLGPVPTDGMLQFSLMGVRLFLEPFSSVFVSYVVVSLLYVNLVWGLVNLLPIYPLDGGQVARELFTLTSPREGIIRSLWLSIVMAGLVAIVGFPTGGLFVVFIFGYLAYQNYQTLRAYQGNWSGGDRW